MSDNNGSFEPIPGYVDPRMMGGSVPGMPTEEDMNKEKDKARKQQAEQLLEQYTQQLINQSQESLEKSRATQGQSPIGVNINASERGVESLGGTLRLPISPRIGLDVGGGYALPQSQNVNILDRNTPIQAEGQFTGKVGYRSPFINVDLNYAPNSGFGGRMFGQGRF